MTYPLLKMKLRSPLNDSTLKRNLGGSFGAGARSPTNSNPNGIHQGWDLVASEGTRTYAIADGKIENVYADLGGYGLSVVLNFIFDGRQLYAIYGHLSSVTVEKGQAVAEGKVVAKTGTSGNAEGTKPHLHFGIMTSSTPQLGLSNFISPGHIVGYGGIQGLTTDDLIRSPSDVA